MVVSGCHISVAEQWWLMPEALGLTPSSTTFLSFPKVRASIGLPMLCYCSDSFEFTTHSIYHLYSLYCMSIACHSIDKGSKILHTNPCRLHYTYIYRMRLNFRGTKLSRTADLHNIRGFYFRG